MKLHDALRKLCKEYGNTIIQKTKVVYLLSDLGAFEDHPELREVIKLIVSGGFARKFCSLSHLKDFEDFFDHAEDDIDKLYDLAGENLAGYAVDSIAYAFGLIDDPSEMDSSLKAASRTDNGDNAAASPAIPVTLDENGEMFEECRRKAEQGDADVQLRLGSLYFSGKGVERDPGKAEKWWRRAAAQGSAEAAQRLESFRTSHAECDNDHEKAYRIVRYAAVFVFIAIFIAISVYLTLLEADSGVSWLVWVPVNLIANLVLLIPMAFVNNKIFDRLLK